MNRRDADGGLMKRRSRLLNSLAGGQDLAGRYISRSVVESAQIRREHPSPPSPSWWPGHQPDLVGKRPAPGAHRGRPSTLYVLLDIFSRAMWDWMAADRENPRVAAALTRTVSARPVHRAPGDSPSASAPRRADDQQVPELCADLGGHPSGAAIKQVSDVQPLRGAVQDPEAARLWPLRRHYRAQAFCGRASPWCNSVLHAGIASVTPDDAIIEPRAPDVLAKRDCVPASRLGPSRRASSTAPGRNPALPSTADGSTQPATSTS